MNMGMGAMLHLLGGGSDKDPSDYYGRTITNAEIDDERMIIELDSKTRIKIFDDGQSCCESRYITCDDDVKDLIGGKLTKIESSEGDEDDGEYGEVHEWVFIEIATDKDHIKFCTHNEHNGYYGGFGLSVTELESIQ